jgi:hypothetical protein
VKDEIFVYPQDAEHDTGTGFKAFKRQGGLELRDYFAGRAIMLFGHTWGPSLKEPMTSQLAEACYRVADAFLAEREKGRDSNAKS